MVYAIKSWMPGTAVCCYHGATVKKNNEHIVGCHRQSQTPADLRHATAGGRVAALVVEFQVLTVVVPVCRCPSGVPLLCVVMMLSYTLRSVHDIRARRSKCFSFFERRRDESGDTDLIRPEIVFSCPPNGAKRKQAADRY